MEVKEFAVIPHCLKAVRKSLRYQHSAVVVFAEDFRMPPKKRRRSSPQVHGDVENLTTQTTDHLDLSIGWVLKVKAANRSLLSCQGVIDLNYISSPEQRMKFFGTEHPLKVTSIISKGLPVHYC
jgi:hypothetical protein